MSVDVNAVNERLNGLVTLLKAVGVDDLNTGDMARVSNGLKNSGGGVGGLPDARQLNDEQIEAIIKKLQMAQQEAPQIIAALEAHAEARSLNGGDSRSRSRRAAQEEEEDEDEDDDEDDEFDEDANYPMVGHGCSDDISVVSDLTTPTVVNDRHVPEEERNYINDALPPMIVGGGGAPSMLLSQPKKKNMIGSSRPGQSRNRIAPPSATRKGGAAAARQQRHHDTMHKLQDNTPPPKKSSRKAKDPSKKTRKVRPQEPENHDYGRNQWESGANQGWGQQPSVPQQTTRKSPKKKTTAIDDDGFLVAESFDPFATGGSNPFSQTQTSSAGDLAFGSGRSGADPFSSSHSSNGFDAFANSPGGPRKSKKKVERSMQSSFSSSQSGTRKQSGAAPRRRARRASLAM